MIDKFKQFITTTQLFWASPSYNAKILLILTSVSVLMIAVGILIWLLLKNKSQKLPPYQEFKNKFASLFISCGIIGLILAFFNWQLIPYLSSRILILILIIIFIIWLISIFIYIKRRFSWELVKFQQDERYKKYLPRKKIRG